jgi:hypothetical protein
MVRFTKEEILRSLFVGVSTVSINWRVSLIPFGTNKAKTDLSRCFAAYNRASTIFLRCKRMPT